MKNQRTPVKAVAEIVINVTDIGPMREFYETVLGFVFFKQYPDENPTITFLTIAELDSSLGRGGHPQMFALIDVHRHPPAQQRFTGIDVTTSTFNHVAFEIDPADFEAEKLRLESHGLTVRIQHFPDMNAKALFFKDPEGNTIEFICHHQAK